MNFLLLLLLAVVNFGLIALSYKLFGRKGVIGFIVLSVIAANLQVNKAIIFDIFGFELEATLGNVMFGGVFLATDLLSEIYGKKVALKAVYISIFANISFIIVMFISTLFESLDYTMEYSNAIDLFFKINFDTFLETGGAFKAVLVGNLVYLVSQSLDVHVYQKLKDRFTGYKLLFIRNNGSTIVSQAVDSILVTIGFAMVGIFPFSWVGGIIITTIAIKYMIAVIDTPFLYLMARIKPLDDN